METLRIKCPKCNTYSNVKMETLLPYRGKIVAVKCVNPPCGYQIKVEVPAMDPPKPAIPEIPLTEVPSSSRNGVSGSVLLTIQKNSKTGFQQYELHEGVNIIGRYSQPPGENVPDVAILTADKVISRNHCQILLSRNKFGNIELTLKDHKSMNGTFLKNAKKLGPDEEVYLENGDIFMIGETTAEIEFIYS